MDKLVLGRDPVVGGRRGSQATVSRLGNGVRRVALYRYGR